MTGVNDNWWVGLSLLHTLFTREHNAICDRLLAAYPARRGDDEWLYQKARLVNIAVIAKIYTVEWTPALLNNPTTALRHGLVLVGRVRRDLSSVSAGA